ncbi:UDP-N-acetylmuramoyl-tripeptide--D-alanyl-D-alanine ligase [Thiofilum flexile]|uniref:UDP-N-acetylmuramoyl-tripeptide--D-alanyl-D- alanine ligase n=1 Tax=Thiofilum flexile TaxID=125627 RepID=UPI00036B69EF|nr:UDP-N-acetylmuramoyl-tripeptide--D-alanyl-D-alanine ligase [Thiofilum flexile]
MSWMTVAEVAQRCGGRLVGADVAIDAVQRDSRLVKQGDLFLALKGERFDAHEFVPQVVGKASAALVSRIIDCDLPQVVVDDVRLALGRLAASWRTDFTKPLLALTGSNGKTTLKEMLTAILNQAGHTLATEGNLNNDIGVPLTLLRLRAEHEFAVIEMGANHFGEINYLTHLAQPDVAILNNAGAAHLEGFGDIAGVARAKGEIFQGLRPNGAAILNADDTYYEYWESITKPFKILSFGLNNKADIKGRLSGNQLSISTPQGEVNLRLALLGRHNALNALAATAGALALGISLEQIKQGLEQLKPVKGRLASYKTKTGTWLIDDTYNANPSSMEAALKVLADLPGRRIFILGDMGELGTDAVQLHAHIGELAQALNINALYGLGEKSLQACQAFGTPETGFTQLEALLTALAQQALDHNTVILVKGSRSAKMERVVAALMQAQLDEVH